MNKSEIELFWLLEITHAKLIKHSSTVDLKCFCGYLHGGEGEKEKRFGEGGSQY